MGKQKPRGRGEGEGVRDVETEVRLGSRGVRGIREGHTGLGSPAGAGPAGYGRGPSPPTAPIPAAAAAAAAAELPSYQVTAGFGSFSLARPQPIREQRRCSRAGGLEMHLPPTPSEARCHTITVAHTHCPRDTQHHLTHTHTITVTHTVSYAVPGTRRDTQHHTDTQSIGDTDVVPGHTALRRPTTTMTPSVAQTHAISVT